MENGIYKAITGVMKDIGAIGKNDVNEYDKYKFRGIDAVYNAIQPALVKNGVFIVPNLLELEQDDRQTAKGGTQIHSKVKVEYTLFAEDGSFIKGVFPGEAMDRSDKSINKAMTAAYKYMLFELFTIPTEDNNDADSESPDAGQKATPQVAAPTEKNADKKMTDSQVKKLQGMLDDKGLPYDWTLKAINAGITDMKQLTVLKGKLIATHLDKLVEKFAKEQAEAEPFPKNDVQFDIDEELKTQQVALGDL